MCSYNSINTGQYWLIVLKIFSMFVSFFLLIFMILSIRFKKKKKLLCVKIFFILISDIKFIFNNKVLRFCRPYWIGPWGTNFCSKGICLKNKTRWRHHFLSSWQRKRERMLVLNKTLQYLVISLEILISRNH